MQGIENYIGFLLAGILLNLTPGADSIYIFTRSIAQGNKAGVYSVLGISTGAFIHVIAAGIGLSALLAQSAAAFNIVKYLGTVYLVYLGIKMLSGSSSLLETDRTIPEEKENSKIYWQGFFTNLLNPKVALFFLSFLPQFIKQDYVNSAIPFLILGGTFLVTGAIWGFVLVHAASYFTSTLRKRPKVETVLKKIGGAVFIALSIHLLFNKISNN